MFGMKVPYIFSRSSGLNWRATDLRQVWATELCTDRFLTDRSVADKASATRQICDLVYSYELFTHRNYLL
jgi:hypothetical protein